MTNKNETRSIPNYQYYDFLLVGFVVVLLCANLIGAGKVAQIELPFVGKVVFGAGILFFPISYAFSNIFTEVYGYGYDRRAVWCGFTALLFAAFMSQIVIRLDTAPGDYNRSLQSGLEIVFGNTWRIVVGSMVAYWCGSLINAYVLAKLKIFTQGRYLWLRVILSTAAAEGVDSSIFYLMAFYGIWPLEQLIRVALLQYVLKTSWEVLAVPITYRIVALLKRIEQVDYYDRDTNFNPFRIKV